MLTITKWSKLRLEFVRKLFHLAIGILVLHFSDHLHPRLIILSLLTSPGVFFFLAASFFGAFGIAN